MNRPALLRSALLLALLLTPKTAFAQPPAHQEESAATQQELAPSAASEAGATQVSEEEATAAQAPQLQEPDPEAPQAIDAGEIPSRAELVAADLRRIEALLQPAAEIERIESAFSAREVGIVRLLATLDAVDPSRTSTRRLEDLRLPWLELNNELVAWSAVVRGRYSTLQVERERLGEIRARWDRTVLEADSDELSPSMLQRVEDVLARVVDVEARTRERRNDLGAIAGRITASQELVSDSLQRIDVLAETLRRQLLTRETEPLWLSLRASAVRPFASEASHAGRDWWTALITYIDLRPGSVAFLAVCFSVLLLAAFHLRREIGRWSMEDADSERLRSLVSRPFSAASAFALAIGALILPYPVGASTDLIIVLATVPMLRLGTVLLEAEARRKLGLVAALVILARVAAVGPGGSTVTRLLLLAVSALGFVGTARAVMRGLEPLRARRGWYSATRTLASVAAILLVVSIGANILGWLRLSKLLTQATIVSLFGAFGWAILVLAVAALLPVVLSGWLGRALPSLGRNQTTIRRTTLGALGILATILWLRGTLFRFQAWEPLRAYGARIGTSGLSIGDLEIQTGGILGAILILVVTWLTARFVGFVLSEEVVPRLRFRRGEGQSLITLVNYTVYAIGIVMAASALGLTGTQLAVVVGALSLGIGFGLQTIVNNFVSGLILIFERPIKVGDTVQTVDHWGRVEHIGIRASTIRSFDGAEIIVPNGDLIAKEVINWTRTDEIRRAEVLVGVAYGTDPEAVLEILLRVAEEHSRARSHPEPKAQMIRFGDSSLDFRLRCWTKVDDWIDLVSDLHVAINRELEEAGITIPFPQRDLHIKPQPGATDTDIPPVPEPTDLPE